MNELIQIQVNEEGVETVNARDIHEFVESKQKFTDWIEKRIEKYGFVQNKDYVSFHKKMKREVGGTTCTEYHCTLNMAKELAMVEGNRKGQEIRRWFIEREERLTVLEDHLLNVSSINKRREIANILTVNARTIVALKKISTVLYSGNKSAQNLYISQKSKEYLGYCPYKDAGIVLEDKQPLQIDILNDVRTFIDQKCFLDVDESVDKKELYNHFMNWLSLNKEASYNAFCKCMAALGFYTGRTGSGPRFYKGLKVAS